MIQQNNTIYIMSLVRWLGWVFEAQERNLKKSRSLVIITIPIPQSTPNIQIHPLPHNIHVFRVHCESACEPGASRLPYYCTLPLCVPDVIGAPAVWRQNNNQKKIQRNTQQKKFKINRSTDFRSRKSSNSWPTWYMTRLEKSWLRFVSEYCMLSC